MYKPFYNKRKALVFKQFTHKGWSLFACLGRVVVIGVLSASTLQNATAAHRHVSTDDEPDDSIRIDKEMTIDDVEVTASRAPLALGQAARMVTVLTRDDIQAAPVQSVNDLLKYVAGVDVRQRGPIGAQTDIGIRGGSQEQIAILLNGINICDPQTGHNTFDLPVDMTDIERIEVLEGPAARVYGTSSLMGAINIVTRCRMLGDGGRMLGDGCCRLEAGSFGYLSAGARTSLTVPRTIYPDSEGIGGYYSLSAGYTRSDGYSRSKGGRLNSDYQGGKAMLEGRLLANNLKLQWHAGMSIKGFGSNTFYSAKYDEQYERTAKLFSALQADVDAGGLHFHPVIYWNRSHDRFELIRGNEDKVAYNYHRTDVFGINLNSWFDSPLGRTAFGAEFRNEDIVSSNLGELLNNQSLTDGGHYTHGLNRSNLSFHLEHNIVTRYFTLSAGLVAVKNTWNQMPFQIYPGIDASVRVGERWKLYASYNTSLRMPSFTELYYSVGGHKADKYLKPEELQAVECGIKYYGNILNAMVGGFHYHQRNTIDWIMDTRDPEGVWKSVNQTKINTLGIEADMTVELGRLFTYRQSSPFMLRLSYCYMHQQKEDMPYIQSRYSLEYLRHKLTAQLQVPLFSRMSMMLACRYQDRSGSYTDTEGVVRDYRPYAVVDGRLSWNDDRWTAYIEGNNLTGTHYVDYGNVRQPGCWIMAGFNILIDN